MSRSEFPHWAPREIIELYRRMLCDPGTDTLENAGLTPDRVSDLSTQVELYREILTNPGMKLVWDILRERDRKPKLQDKTSRVPGTMSYAITLTRAYSKRSPWEDLSPGNRRKAAEKIATKARELASLTRQYQIGEYLLEFFTEEELRGMHLLLGGHGTAMDAQALSSRAVKSPPIPSFRRPFLYRAAPTLSDLLKRIEESLEESPPYSNAKLRSKPKKLDREVVYMIRCLGEHNGLRYNTPLHGVIADTVNVVYPGCELSEDGVREQLQGLTPRTRQ